MARKKRSFKENVRKAQSGSKLVFTSAYRHNPQGLGDIEISNSRFGFTRTRKLPKVSSVNKYNLFFGDFRAGVDWRKICKERKERKQVLHALGKVGGNHKPPTYTFKSLVRC